jgi:hypothetical protein
MAFVAARGGGRDLSPYSDAETEEALRLAIDTGLIPASGVVRVPQEQGDDWAADEHEPHCGR